jgi:hypothetical protein
MYNQAVTNNRINQQDIKQSYIDEKLIKILDWIKNLTNIIF